MYISMLCCFASFILLCLSFYILCDLTVLVCCFFFATQKTAYEMRISDWSSDVCSSDLTAASTTVTATTAPLICPIALIVASLGDRPSSVMMRSTFSMTMIASSTTMPIASTMPNKLSWLMVKPSTHRPTNVPISATGITSVGISVARKFCRKISITRNTSKTAPQRAQEHTYELQSLMRISYAVFCLKKQHTTHELHSTHT